MSKKEKLAKAGGGGSFNYSMEEDIGDKTPLHLNKNKSDIDQSRGERESSASRRKQTDKELKKQYSRSTDGNIFLRNELLQIKKL